jgi:L-asparagine transporter-like permease
VFSLLLMRLLTAADLASARSFGEPEFWLAPILVADADTRAQRYLSLISLAVILAVYLVALHSCTTDEKVGT